MKIGASDNDASSVSAPVAASAVTTTSSSSATVATSSALLTPHLDGLPEIVYALIINCLGDFKQSLHLESSNSFLRQVCRHLVTEMKVRREKEGDADDRQPEAFVSLLQNHPAITRLDTTGPHIVNYDLDGQKVLNPLASAIGQGSCKHLKELVIEAPFQQETAVALGAALACNSLPCLEELSINEGPGLVDDPTPIVTPLLQSLAEGASPNLQKLRLPYMQEDDCCLLADVVEARNRRQDCKCLVNCPLTDTDVGAHDEALKRVINLCLPTLKNLSLSGDQRPDIYAQCLGAVAEAPALKTLSSIMIEDDGVVLAVVKSLLHCRMPALEMLHYSNTFLGGEVMEYFCEAIENEMWPQLRELILYEVYLEPQDV